MLGFQLSWMKSKSKYIDLNVLFFFTFVSCQGLSVGISEHRHQSSIPVPLMERTKGASPATPRYLCAQVGRQVEPRPTPRWRRRSRGGGMKRRKGGDRGGVLVAIENEHLGTDTVVNSYIGGALAQLLLVDCQCTT